MPQRPVLLAIMGPTGSGKTELAETVADQIDAQLINADAFQVYRGMDIGTAKPVNRDRYHLLDLKHPSESFGVGEWIRAVLAHLDTLWEQRRNVIIVGGTGFYIRSLFEQYSDLFPAPDPALREELSQQEAEHGLASLIERLRSVDPESLARIDQQNPVRVRRAIERALTNPEPIEINLPPFRKHKFALLPEGDAYKQTLRSRSERMLGSGWVAEVEMLREEGVRPTDPGMRAIGYQWVYGLVEGKIDPTEVLDRLCQDTWRYAKRQRTWLKTEPELNVFRFCVAGESGVEDAPGVLLEQIADA